jgi:hypothetical protein
MLCPADKACVFFVGRISALRAAWVPNIGYVSLPLCQWVYDRMASLIHTPLYIDMQLHHANE